MIKSLSLASAAVLTLAAAPAFAQDAVGSIGVAYSDSSVESSGFSADGETWTVDGVTAIPAYGDWTVTLAADVSNIDYGSGSDTLVNGTVGVSRVFGDTRFGGFVGRVDIDGDDAWTIGAQGQKYLGRATLTGAVAYSDVNDGAGKVWSLGADAAFYATQNLRLNGGLSWSDVDAAGGDVDVWSYGVGAEYQIGSSPFTVTGGYTRTDISDYDVEADTFRVGLRYSFGGGLQARDRAGATAPTVGVASLLSVL